MPRRRGYTVLEVILVLAILVVLATLAYPSLDSMYVDYKVIAAADQIRAAWADAQAHSIDEGRPYRFAIVLEDGNYRVAPDSNQYWGNSDAQSDSQEGNVKAYILENKLERGVQFVQGDPTLLAGQNGSRSTAPATDLATKTDANGWTSIATFLPDGTALEDVQIRLQGKRSRPVELSIRGLTGVVRMKVLQPEGSRP